METITFTYCFRFKDGRKREHSVQLDSLTGRLISSASPSPHAWTALDHNKCEHCPLNSKTSPQCPVARNLAEVANDFKGERSFEEVTVEVVSAERTYLKDLQLQEGLFGLFGLIMATSDCPYFSFLRPMARFHLPFSSVEETMVRSASFYLFKQYFVAQKGGQPDLNLDGFTKLYADLSSVNRGICDRIRAIAKADADANSIVILDAFASLLATQIQNKFSDLTELFAG